MSVKRRAGKRLEKRARETGPDAEELSGSPLRVRPRRSQVWLCSIQFTFASAANGPLPDGAGFGAGEAV